MTSCKTSARSRTQATQEQSLSNGQHTLHFTRRPKLAIEPRGSSLKLRAAYMISGGLRKLVMNCSRSRTYSAAQAGICHRQNATIHGAGSCTQSHGRAAGIALNIAHSPAPREGETDWEPRTTYIERTKVPAMLHGRFISLVHCCCQFAGGVCLS